MFTEKSRAALDLESGGSTFSACEFRFAITRSGLKGGGLVGSCLQYSGVESTLSWRRPLNRHVLWWDRQNREQWVTRRRSSSSCKGPASRNTLRSSAVSLDWPSEFCTLASSAVPFENWYHLELQWLQLQAMRSTRGSVPAFPKGSKLS